MLNSKTPSLEMKQDQHENTVQNFVTDNQLTLPSEHNRTLTIGQ